MPALHALRVRAPRRLERLVKPQAQRTPRCHTTAPRGGLSLLAHVLPSAGFKVGGAEPEGNGTVQEVSGLMNEQRL